ncbi:MAG: hypothetical protein Q4F97_04835 [Bacteroidales bacterium]|nr:hypothetical protein [Bacteroidales bacterium]
MALLQEIQLLQMEYKRAKRCSDYLSKRISLQDVGIDSVNNALDAAEFIFKYNQRVDDLIDKMYESCENRFMIDRVRLLKIMKKA